MLCMIDQLYTQTASNNSNNSYAARNDTIALILAGGEAVAYTN